MSKRSKERRRRRYWVLGSPCTAPRSSCTVPDPYKSRGRSSHPRYLSSPPLTLPLGTLSRVGLPEPHRISMWPYVLSTMKMIVVPEEFPDDRFTKRRYGAYRNARHKLCEDTKTHTSDRPRATTRRVILSLFVRTRTPEP